jgi:Domain of unknown function (DUF1707)
VVYGPGQAHPPLPAVPPGSGFTGVSPAWLAGSADRERTVGVLRAAFTEGRLNQDELDDRVARTYAARTYGELWALIADLPAGPLPYPAGLPAVPYPQASPAVPPSAEPDTSWHSAAALVITALVIFTLAALVTAIATAHAQAPIPFQQGSYQPAQLEPIRQAQLAPFITNAGGQEPRHAPAPVRP